MSANVRDYLKTELTPLIPSTWRIIPEQRMPDTITKTTVVLKHLRITRLPAAPIGSLDNSVVITIADPHKETAAAENALDDNVLELVTAIDGHDNISWSLAEKVNVNDTYLGWDITVAVTTQKE